MTVVVGVQQKAVGGPGRNRKQIWTTRENGKDGKMGKMGKIGKKGQLGEIGAIREI